mmetsp:Transcript_12985/g.54406  ORF Transcript_12985/g.54406 Transcript_12985/m.54406 type:complete len:219 (-) Transcript_12985:1484-2140(-)
MYVVSLSASAASFAKSSVITMERWSALCPGALRERKAHARGVRKTASPLCQRRHRSPSLTVRGGTPGTYPCSGCFAVLTSGDGSSSKLVGRNSLRGGIVSAGYAAAASRDSECSPPAAASASQRSRRAAGTGAAEYFTPNHGSSLGSAPSGSCGTAVAAFSAPSPSTSMVSTSPLGLGTPKTASASLSSRASRSIRALAGVRCCMMASTHCGSQSSNT